MINILLTLDEVDYQSALGKIVNDQDGAVNCFLGVVRQEKSANSKFIKALFYEAYLEMAKLEIEKLVEQVSSKYAIRHFCLIHRLGYVKIGQVSLCIIISAKHRHSALQSTILALDILKKRVPIWKKEIYKDGTSMWKEYDNYSASININ